MAWFRKAAEQGHPNSAYNLAVGHFTGIKTGKTEKLVKLIKSSNCQTAKALKLTKL
jgi:TPR repeat protein